MEVNLNVRLVVGQQSAVLIPKEEVELAYRNAVSQAIEYVMDHYGLANDLPNCYVDDYEVTINGEV